MSSTSNCHTADAAGAARHGSVAEQVVLDKSLATPLGALLREAAGRAAPELLLASLLVTLLALALPIALLQVYDRVLPNAAIGTLEMLAIIVLIAILMEAGLRMLRGQILGRLAAAAEAQAHRAAMGRILNTPSHHFEAHGNGYYSERLAAIGSLREAWSGPALQAMLDVPFALLYLVVIWWIAGSLVLVPFGVLLAVVLVAALRGGRVRKRAERLALAEEHRFNFLFDTLRGLQSLKLFGAEGLIERRYERLQGSTARLRRELSNATASVQETGLLLAQVSTVGTAAWGCLMVINGTLTVGSLGACTMLAGRCMQPLLSGAALWSRLQAVGHARRSVGELALLPSEARPSLPPLRPTVGHIALHKVRFGKMPDGRPLFDDLSLEVAPGEIIGIVAPNGSGRSALLRLVTGELYPVSGAVLVDGQDLRWHDSVPARRLVALVPPDPALLRATLLENLTLHQPELTEAALGLAVAMGLDVMAARLPGHWHTPVGIGATPLPRGVAQRIGIVRALVQQPRILLLDDVNAQLDQDGDARIIRLLANLRGRTTVILVSHRRSVLAVADRVLHIANGRLQAPA